MRMQRVDSRKIKTFIITAVLAILLILYLVINPDFTGDKAQNEMLKSTVTRFLGAGIFFVLIRYLGYDRILKIHEKGRRERILLILPFLLVVLNNFPIIGLITGNVTYSASGYFVPVLFVCECIAIGLFEELAFRGTMLLYILENRRDSRKKVFWVTVISSAVFGLVHLMNLFAGSSPVSVLLQIGYSFLIGGMCALALLMTKNIWIPVILHALFDMGGKFVTSVGDGFIWDWITVSITAVLGVAVLAYALLYMKRFDFTETEDLYYVEKE